MPVYERLYDDVRAYGQVVDSRHGKTFELVGQNIRFAAGYIPERGNANWRIGYMELMQLIGGTYDIEQIKRIAPRARIDLWSPMSSYGLRLEGQIPTVLDGLRADPQGRQHVLFIANRVSEQSTSDLPCTLSMQFLLRKGTLHSIVSMRSWDLTRGAPYDIIMFGGLTMAIAHVLDVLPGYVTVNAGSAHIYQDDGEIQKTTLRRRFEFTWDFPNQPWPMWKAWALQNAEESDLWQAGIPIGMQVVSVKGLPAHAASTSGF